MVLMVAYDNAEATGECLARLGPELGVDDQLLLLDNGSSPAQAVMLREAVQQLGGRGRYLRSDINTGFAGGMNRLLSKALTTGSGERFLLLNNDTVPTPGFLARLLAVIDLQSRIDMAAARMMVSEHPDMVDSLGIALYRSGLASNRKRVQQRLLGPTGGCMLLTRRVLEDLHSSHGEWFDETFFCYAEDSDLVMRARWLGYESGYADDALVLHHGSLSSGGPDNEFVLYHGIRNSIWALVKNAPALWLLAHLPWLLVAHGGIWLRNLRKRRWRTLLRLYWHALRGLPVMLGKRRRIRRSRRMAARQWWSWIEPSLYEPDYLRRAWRELFRRR